ncbi:MAG: metal-dependent hydrolase [Cyanobacteria bacterium P01_G01_bin.49]
MPSPIGHSLAGISGFFLIRYHSQLSQYFSDKTLLITGIIVANLPDIDFILGYLFFNDFSKLHRQFTHSFFVGLVISILMGHFITKRKKTAYVFTMWLLGLYYSHILLDMLAYDRYPPGGVQCFFPFDFGYFALPITILAGLNMTNGIWDFGNILTILQEIIVIPLLFLVIFLLIKLAKNQSSIYGKNQD